MMSQNGPYQNYKALNQQFADTIVNNYKDGDISKKQGLQRYFVINEFLL